MSKTSQKSVAKKLQETREFLGYTQIEVSKYLGIPRSAISLIENGKRKIDSIELVKLSSLFQKPVEYWTDDKNEPLGKLDILQRAVGELAEEDVDQVVKFAKFLKSQSNFQKG